MADELDIITESSKNQLLEMAFTRNDFKNKVEEYATGAFFEYVTAAFFEYNNETKWVEHKRNEVSGLFNKLDASQFLTSKGSWDKKKAAKEVIDRMQENTSKYFTAASNTFERYFKKKPKTLFNAKEKDELTTEFFRLVQSVIDAWIV